MKKHKNKRKVKRVCLWLVYKLVLPSVFIFFRLLPVRNDLVIFAADHHSVLPDNMKGLFNLCKQNNFDCRTFLKQPTCKNNPFIRKWNKLWYMLKFTALFAQCKCLFLTEYFFLAYINKPRKDTMVVQLWHGCGAFKKFGYSSRDTDWGRSHKISLEKPMHNNYTHVIVSAESVIPFYAEAFNCDPSIIFPWGTPRTDKYFDKEFVAMGRKKLLEMYPNIGSRKIILYAPTFRGKSIPKSYNENQMDFESMSKILGDDFALVIKLHPLTRRINGFNIEEYSSFCYDVTHSVSIEEAMCAADILITDYSSVVFEYALLERPMLFFAYDLEEYINSRGFYFEYKDFVPGPIVYSTQEIIEKVIELEQGFDPTQVRKFHEKFMSGCDGKSTERIWNKLFGKS
jgi:CDP-glycerol glycerophosphotransferase (TagB/SpsB family)